MSLLRFSIIGTLSVLALVFCGAALAGDGVVVDQVVSGFASLESSGTQTTITASDGAIIDYHRFDVPQDAGVQFVQPSEQARVLNRVLSPDPSRIDGSLTANGIVYLVNPAGVLFGPGAIVDVGALYAAAGSISSEDFANGLDLFLVDGGVLQNDGALHAQGDVHLIGAHVQNRGSIVSRAGIATLSSGAQVYLAEEGASLLVRVDHLDAVTGSVAGADPEAKAPQPTDAAGVLNDGSVEADRVVFSAGDVYSLAVLNRGAVTASGGEVTLAGDGLVANEGAIDVSDASAGSVGGNVHLLGDRVGVFAGTIDASGDAGGGEILVGGDYGGEGAARSASATGVAESAVLKADALSEGDGGRVIVWADETTNFYGHLSARGGDVAGDGGFAEVSAGGNLAYRGDADLSAPRGDAGTLLLDPATLTITGGSGDGAADGTGAFSGSSAGSVLFVDGGPTTVYETEIEAQSASASITLEATRTITTAGNFTDDAVTLAADRNLVIRTRNTESDGSGGIDLTASADGTNLAFVTQGSGSISISGSTDGGATGNVTLGTLTAGSGAITATTNNGSLTLHRDLSTSGGDITLAGPVNLAASIGVSTGPGVGDIQFSDVLGSATGAYDLTLTAGTGAVLFGAAVGGLGGFAPLVSSTNPLSFWRLGESAGTTAVDLGGTSNGVYQNGVTLSQSGALAGDSDTASLFDGSNDFVEIPHSSSYLLDSGTVQFWFNRTSSGQRGLFSKDSSGYDTGGHLTIYSNSSNRLQVRLQSASADYNVTSPSALQTGRWYQAALSFGSDGLRLYQNGQLVDFDAYTGGLGTTSGGTGNFEPLGLGASTWGSGNLVATPISNPTAGRLDDVSFHSGALTGSTLSQLYATGTGRGGGALGNLTVASAGTVTAQSSLRASATSITSSGAVDLKGAVTGTLSIIDSSPAAGAAGTAEDLGGASFVPEPHAEFAEQGSTGSARIAFIEALGRFATQDVGAVRSELAARWGAFQAALGPAGEGDVAARAGQFVWALASAEDELWQRLLEVVALMDRIDEFATDDEERDSERAELLHLLLTDGITVAALSAILEAAGDLG